jgi:hypothetical protein
MADLTCSYCGKAEQSKTAFAFHVCDQNTLKDLLTASRAEVKRLTLAVESLEGVNAHCKMWHREALRLAEKHNEETFYRSKQKEVKPDASN